jgi:hypothetical protein
MIQDSSKGSQGLQKRPYPGCATPKWAQSPRQAVMWSSSHMAVLGSDGILSVVDIRTLDACLQISGCSGDAVLAAAGAFVQVVIILCGQTLWKHDAICHAMLGQEVLLLARQMSL